jgi:uncharacterized repeat protein (TIGR03803 family)
VIFDTSGNLYGTTVQGGANGVGTVFRLALTANKPWTTVLHSFNGTDGAEPAASVIFDASGNLYGTTSIGGNNSGRGTVFELKPQANGKWTETVLHSFHGVDGDVPEAALILDASGNLYGTTNQGGHQSCGCGVVFKLTPSSSGHWTEAVLHAFSSKEDGAYPAAALVFDGTGNLYSTMARGGSGGGGTVFELSPGANGAWKETLLHSFSKKEGGPSRVIFDEVGSLYGETIYGGKQGYGTVFKLTEASGQWTETILLSFNGTNGIEPTGGVILDMAGDLYGTTAAGGLGCAPSGCGVVFEITPVV